MASGSEGITSATENDINQNRPLHEDSSLEAMQISNLDETESQRKQEPPINIVADDSDSNWLGRGRPIEDIRPQAVMSVGRDADFYKIDHKKRGQALIFVNDQFSSLHLEPRKCAAHDTAITKRAFAYLGFEVKEHWNLRTRDLLKTLQEVSSEDHSDSDCLAVVFMSHGNVDHNKEFLCTRDSKIDTEELWKNFTADKCPSLAGKPKFFFIQACRGDNIDKGVKMKQPKALKVQMDGVHHKEDYVIPLHADMLMMWASYPGMFAFKSYQNGMNGSVFIHFLSKVLMQDGRTCDLFTLLLRVTREVATQYESCNPKVHLIHQNKQIPYMVSTLMRKMVFPVWKP